MTSRAWVLVCAAGFWGCTPPEMAAVTPPGAESPPTVVIPEDQRAEGIGESGTRVGSWSQAQTRPDSSTSDSDAPVETK